MYEAFTADGTCLPPVIFVSHTHKRSTDLEGLFKDKNGNIAYVIYMPDLHAPSTDSTVAWLETMTKPNRNYLSDSPTVVLDSLRGHFAEKAITMWDSIGATLYRLPGGSGKWLNPCDQAINREMRRTFLRLQQHNRANKLCNIIEAYYSVNGSTIVESFARCGLFEGDPEEIVSSQASQGFHPPVQRKDDCERYTSALNEWFKHSVRSAADVLPRSKEPSTHDSTLDGTYWTRYGGK